MVSLHVAVAVMALSNVGQTVLFDFYTDQCGPCREMNPTVQALAKAGYPVQRINAGQNRELAARYGIYKVPCFVMVVNGNEVGRILGKTSYGNLEQLCQAGAAASHTPPSPSAPAYLANNAFGPPAASAVLQPALPMPAAAAPAPAAGLSDAALLAVSVRLRVKDPDGNSCGSGTIIDSRGDEALVLTCGHIFRDSQGKGEITVELFQSGKAQPTVGRLISYDLGRDVALVAIRTPGPVTVARVAPSNYQVQPGAAVASVGCNHGDDPTVRRTEVARLNRFNGPPNLQVTDQPVEGRSGGGLFTQEGYVIGVCIFADPSTQQGTYAAPAAIYTELDQNHLAAVYSPTQESPIRLPGETTSSAIAAVPTPPAALPGPAAAATMLPSAMPGPAPGGDAMAAWTPSAPAVGGGVALASATEPSGALAAHEQAALDEIRRRMKEGAEVVCIVRPRNNPEAKSDVIILDHASPELVKRLAAESRRQGQPFETALELPKPRRILLEWSANGTK